MMNRKVQQDVCGQAGLYSQRETPVTARGPPKVQIRIVQSQNNSNNKR